MSDKKSRDAQSSVSAEPAGLEEIDEAAADGVVGGFGLNTTSLRSLSSAWLATTGVRVLELRTERARNVELHGAVEAAAMSAIASAIERQG